MLSYVGGEGLAISYRQPIINPIQEKPDHASYRR
jgi:hypothetical protein